MKITILGKYGSFPAANGACSGYLIEDGDNHILIDCGNGVLSRLQKYCSIENLDAIVISHLHDDHMGDLRILQYAIETKKAFGEINWLMKLYIPRTPVDVVKELSTDIYDIHFITDELSVKVGKFLLTFAAMQHTVESYAISIENNTTRVVYSGDTILNDRLIHFSKRADVLICESTFAIASRLTAMTPHMTAAQAGYVAREAKVSKLLLTHFWFEENPKECVENAKGFFNNVSAVEEFHSYEV